MGAALNETGLMENTFVLYTSDHGDMRMDHFLWRKSFPYQGSTHIPLQFWWPKSMESKFGSKRGIKVDAITELRDIFPTILDAVNHWNESAAEDFDGRPLIPLLQGTPSTWREYIDMEHSIYCRVDNHWNALTDGRM